MNEAPVLDVRDLTVTAADGAHPVRGLGFRLWRGERIALTGESAAGTSVAAQALLALPPPGARLGGSVRLLGRELLGLRDGALSSVRGNRIALLARDPLSPVHTIAEQVREAVGVHHTLGRAAARGRVEELLRLVGVVRPRDLLDAYAHEVSAATRQRVALAVAVANEPDVIVADEPTAGLDVTVQAVLLEAFEEVRAAIGAAVVHAGPDLGVVAGYADRVIVMYRGRPVEAGGVDEVFHEPRMPYTVGLLGSVPRLDQVEARRLAEVRASRVVPGRGCVFAPRCPLAAEVCRASEPPLRALGAGGHEAACHFAEVVGWRLYGEGQRR